MMDFEVDRVVLISHAAKIYWWDSERIDSNMK